MVEKQLTTRFDNDQIFIWNALLTFDNLQFIFTGLIPLKYSFLSFDFENPKTFWLDMSQSILLLKLEYVLRWDNC